MLPTELECVVHLHAEVTVDQRLQLRELLWEWVLGWPSPFSKFAAFPDRIGFVIDMDRDLVIAELRKLLPVELVEDVTVGETSWEA